MTPEEQVIERACAYIRRRQEMPFGVEANDEYDDLEFAVLALEREEKK